MSYAIGWKDDQHVYLSADTLFGANFDLAGGKQSATGEDFTKLHKGKYWADAYLKIWVIEDIAIAFVSNDVYEAIEFLDELEHKFDPHNRVGSIEKILKAIDPQQSEFLFAFYENKPVLMRFEPGYDNLIEESEPTKIGSLDDNFKDQSYEICGNVIDNESGRSPDDKLALVNSIHQHLLLEGNSVSQSVGGIFTGLFISKAGIFWQKDTVYFNYGINYNKLKPDCSNIKECTFPRSMFQLYNRDNVASYHSGFSNDTSKTNHLFPCTVSNNSTGILDGQIKKRMDWVDKYEKEIDNLIQCPILDYYVFFSVEHGKPCNMHLIKIAGGKPFVIIHCLEDKYYDIDVEMSLIHSFIPENEIHQYRYEFVEAPFKSLD